MGIRLWTWGSFHWIGKLLVALESNGHLRRVFNAFTWSGSRGVDDYTEVLAVGEAAMPTGPLGSLTPGKRS
jgi:hypothetical protein